MLPQPNNTKFSPVPVPDPLALFPLNISYGTKEINNRTLKGNAEGITLAQGPDGKAKGSYEFKGNKNSFIEFPNSDKSLHVRYSMTMLCWLNYSGQGGPIFKYETSENRIKKTHLSERVSLGVYKGKLFAHFTTHSPSGKATSMNTSVAGGWKFVGASYNHTSGEVKLWVDGVMVYEEMIAVGLTLNTQTSVRMGGSHQRSFKGRIAQMQVYNLVLTQEQIREIQEKLLLPGENAIYSYLSYEIQETKYVYISSYESKKSILEIRLSYRGIIAQKSK